MADATGGMDPAALMQAAQQMLMFSMAGQTNQPSGISNYTPRFLNPGMADPGSFSPLNALGQLGPMGQQLGMMGMIGGHMFMPEMMSALRSNANVDPVALRQSHMLQRSMMRYSSVNGQAIAASLGHPEWGDTAASMMPMLSAFVPGMDSLISGLTPNNLTRSGAQSMANQAMMMDPQGMLREGNLDALERARAQLTEKGGFRDVAFMSRFSQDDFAKIGEFAKDQAFDVQDIDRAALRDTERGKVMDRLFKGRVTEDLTAAEQAQVSSETSTAVSAQLQIRKTGLAAQGIRSVMDTLGVDRDTALSFAQRSGFSASSQSDVNSFKEATQALEGFAKAAGVGGQQILNMAQALSAQNGGGMMFNSAVAGMAALNARFSNELRGGGGGSGQGTGDAQADDVARYTADFMHSGYAQVLVGGAKLDSRFEAERNRLTRAGDGEGLWNLVTGHGPEWSKEIVRKASGRPLSAAEMTAGTDQFTNSVGGGDAVVGAISGLSEHEAELHIRRSAGIQDILKWSKEDKWRLAEFNRGDLTSDDLAAAGWSAQKVATAQTASANAAPDTALGSYLTWQYNDAVKNHFGETISNVKAVRVAIDAEQTRAQNDQHAGQGLIPGVASGEVKSLTGGLEASGIKATDDETKFTKDLDSAIGVLSDPTASQGEKDKARTRLRGLGAPPAVDVAPNTGTGALKAVPLGMAPRGESPTRVDGQGSGDGKGDRLKVELDIKTNGQPLPVGDFTSRVTMTPGMREAVVNGETHR